MKEGNIQHILFMAIIIIVLDHTDYERGRKEGNVLFNDALNTFCLQLYGVREMVKDQSDSERKHTAPTTWATLSD